MKRFNLTTLVLIILAISSVSQAVTYNLANDWSDLNNPNGAWSLYKAPGQPPNPHVPMWAKAVGDVGNLSGQNIYDGFVDVGTVFMHSAESFRTGTDYSSVVWTSPRAGTALIDGGLWISKAFDRPHTWQLLKNDIPITGGSLSQTDPWDKSNPFAFSAGNGGPSVLEFDVATGDQIGLLIYRPVFTFVPGTFVAVDLTIELVPEPTSLLILAIALLPVLPLRL
jgi:hypothetical protein